MNVRLYPRGQEVGGESKRREIRRNEADDRSGWRKEPYISEEGETVIRIRAGIEVRDWVR